MITSVASFLAYFATVQERTLRDVAAIPEYGLGFRPPGEGDGEANWDVARLVGHLAGTRLRFAEAFNAHRWVVPEEPEVATIAEAVEALRRSAIEVRRLLTAAGDRALAAALPASGGAAPLLGWQVLMSMIEHEIHHRSQIDSYATFAGWSAPQLFGRRWEDVVAGTNPQ